MTAATNRPLEGLSVLVAEDSWHLADAMRITIERAGGKVVGLAGTLEEAEKVAETATFDAAVMDLNLHGRLAHDLVQQLAGKGTKVIVLTGYEPPTTLLDKVHDCLTKPVSVEVLIASLGRPLRGRQA